jgi:hypothetical protein
VAGIAGQRVLRIIECVSSNQVVATETRSLLDEVDSHPPWQYQQAGYWQLCFPPSAALANHLLDLFEYMCWLVCDCAG